MDVIEEKDKLLSYLCKKGKTCTNFISGYTEELASELESKGYIRIIRQVNYEEAEATEFGIEFNRNGGFKGEVERKKEQNADKSLDRKSKEVGIITSKDTVKIARNANRLSIIAIVLSSIVAAIDLLKLLL